MTIKEYWNLIGQEPCLAITWEPDFSQPCIFCRMLMNQKNFHLTQISDKTNYVIFVKNPKTLFLEHFWLFWVIFAWWGLFLKTPTVTYNYVWAHNSMLSFRKKLMSQFRENLQREGRTDRRTDTPYFIEPFRLRTGVQ